MIKSNIAGTMKPPSSLNNAIQTSDSIANNLNKVPEGKQDVDKTTTNDNKQPDPLVSALDTINTTKENSKPDLIKEQVEEAINSSPNLVIALEEVGAMFHIPPENILNDNSLASIRIDGDTISAPEIPINQNNSKAVVMAIGTVLDHISQRIDTKLNEKQCDDVAKCKNIDDPSLGTVVERDFDDDGNPITVYDSGVITHANTPESTKKAAQIRSSLELKYPEEMHKDPEYFTDEDDITKDANMDAIKSNVPDEDVDAKINDIASSIQEESFHLDHIARLGDTTHLGYDLFKEYGFDFVKPTNHPEFIQEEFREDVKKPRKRKKKELTSSDIKYLKFDNKKLIQAIKYFNTAYKEQSPSKDKDFIMKDFMNSVHYQKGLDCINAQLNCRAIIRFYKFQDAPNYKTINTVMFTDLKTKLTVSKSKGFQLGGLPININIVNSAITDYPSSSKNPDFFGQTFTAILLHEIFHNIALVWKIENGEFKTALATTVMLSTGLTSTKDRRILLSNFVETINRFKGMKIGKLTKRFMVKQLLALSISTRNDQMLKQLEQNIVNTKNKTDTNANQDVRKLIGRYQKLAKQLSRTHKTKKVIGLVFAILFAIPTLGLSIMMWLEMSKAMEHYTNSREFEEYYCDLFAGMYNLPVVFFIEAIGSKRKYTPNEIEAGLLKELHDLDSEINKMVLSIYPSTLERNNASIKIAKNMLTSKVKLHPDIKKYLQWIVDNFDSVENLDIDEIYNHTTFDPKTALDLDAHIQSLIDNNQITLTESFFLD